eukprot:GHVN01068608.1.p1 GENE.GHVN01068608.1~~GHVN01068608.1.p1  ORF type:complete len:1688 (-),score=157.80 GHVN01068608.1:2058-6983(-)
MDVCMKTCENCQAKGGDGTNRPVCEDNPFVQQMGYSCDLFLQFAFDGCNTVLGDLLGDDADLPDSVPANTRIKDACPATCRVCTPGGGPSCSDNAIVESMNATCPLLVQFGRLGCNSLLSELTTDASIPKSVRVKDVCSESCGLCKEPSCTDGFQNGDETGVDCGGSCRSCRQCSPAPLKALGLAYKFQGMGVSHTDQRSVMCAEGYQRLMGPEPDVSVCLDGTFQLPTLRCSERQITVHQGILEVLGGTKLDYTAVPSILTALTTTLLIQLPDELRVRSMSSGDDQGGAPTVCKDDENVEKIGYTCQQFASLGCDMLFADLAKNQGATLPPEIPIDMTVGDACAVSCGLCRRALVPRGSGDDDENKLVVTYLIYSAESDAHFYVKQIPDVEQRFLAALRTQFSARNVEIVTYDPILQIETSQSAAVALTSMTTVLEDVEKKDVAVSAWEGSFGAASDEDVARSVTKLPGLAFPKLEGAVSPSASQAESLVGKPYFGSDDSEDRPPDRAPPISPVIIQTASQCASFFGPTDPNSCCSLKGRLQALVDGQCGKRLYGYPLSSAGVKSFCEESNSEERSCWQKALDIVEEYKSRGGAACELVPYVKQMIDSWCWQDTSEGYCFQSVESSRDILDINSLARLPSADLDTMCEQSSCTRSHMRYFDALTQLEVGFSLASKPYRRIRRRLHEVRRVRGLISDYKTNLHQEGVQEHEGDPHWLNFVHHAGFARQLSSITTAQISSFASNHITKGHLNTHTPSRRLEIDFEAPAGDFNEDLLNLVCTKVEGGYCQQTVLLLTEEDPIHSPSLVLQPCATPCFVPITGMLGGIIESYGDRMHSPYHRALGSLMRGYGRFYCTTNERGKLCGEFLMTAVQSAAVEPYIPVGVDDGDPRFLNCGCSRSFLQDGQCDGSCFTDECGYDGEDCLAKRMFPELYSALTLMVRGEECGLYHTSFQCVKECRDSFERAGAIQGCCLSGALEVLGQLIAVEAGNPLVAKNQIWRPDRSLMYLEQACGVSMDRTCMIGRPREVVKADVIIHNIAKAPFESEEKRLMRKSVEDIIIQTVSDRTRVMESDITRLLLRPAADGVLYELVIDAGHQADRVARILKSPTEADHVQDVLNRRLQSLDLKSIRRNTMFPIHASIASNDIRLRSTVDPPMTFQKGSGTSPSSPPYVGSRGLDDLAGQVTLQSEGCNAEDLWMFGSAYSVFAEAANLVGAFDHGATRSISCSRGYGAVVGVTPDTLRCDHGSWIRVNNLKCRARCSEDPWTLFDLSNAYRMASSDDSGSDGSSNHGAERVISCAKGFSAVIGSSPTNIYCRDGQWDNLVLDCRATCPEFPSLGLGYSVEGSGETHGSKRSITCSMGYLVQVSSFESEDYSVYCRDGQWSDNIINCVKPEVIDPSKETSAIVNIMRQLTSGASVLTAIIIVIIVVLFIIVVVISWRLFFRKKAEVHHVEHEKELRELKKKHKLRGLKEKGKTHQPHEPGHDEFFSVMDYPEDPRQPSRDGRSARSDNRYQMEASDGPVDDSPRDYPNPEITSVTGGTSPPYSEANRTAPFQVGGSDIDSGSDYSWATGHNGETFGQHTLRMLTNAQPNNNSPPDGGVNNNHLALLDPVVQRFAPVSTSISGMQYQSHGGESDSDVSNT